MKKKLLITLLTLSILTCITACGGKETEDSKITTEENTEKATGSGESEDSLETLGDIEVDEGIFNVELTIPTEYVGEQTQEDLDEISKEHGFKSIVLNSDGSATYTMTKKQHQDLLEEYRSQINASLDEMIGSADYPNFTKIEANDNFTTFTITTKSSELDTNESFSIMTFYMYGGLYSVFSGETVDNVSVTFINADTGDIISTANSSDMEEQTSP